MRVLWQVLAGRRDYRLLLSAGLVSLTGDWLLRVGLVYHVYRLTGSTLASGAMMLASYGPQIVLGSLTGVLADRWDRRRLMVATNLLQAGVLLGLLFVRSPADLWIVYVVVVAESCLAQLFAPAEQAMVPVLVPSEQLVTANALNGQARDIARLIGAALGGVVIGFGGLTALAIVDAVTFAVSAALIAAIRYRPASIEKVAEELGGAIGRLRREWTEGLRVVRQSRALRVLFVFALVTSVGEGIMGTLFAPFVRDELHASGQVYGFIAGSQAIGGIAGGLVTAAIGPRFSPLRIWAGGALLFGLIDLVLFTYPLVTEAIWPAFVCMIAVGLPGAFTIAGMMTVLQRSTLDTNRGRVFGALFAAEGGAPVLGIAAAGVLGEVVGIIPVLVFQGAGFVVGGLLVHAVLVRRRADVELAA